MSAILSKAVDRDDTVLDCRGNTSSEANCTSKLGQYGKETDLWHSQGFGSDGSYGAVSCTIQPDLRWLLLTRIGVCDIVRAITKCRKHKGNRSDGKNPVILGCEYRRHYGRMLGVWSM